MILMCFSRTYWALYHATYRLEEGKTGLRGLIKSVMVNQILEPLAVEVLAMLEGMKFGMNLGLNNVWIESII